MTLALAQGIIYITNTFQIWNDHVRSHMDNFSETALGNYIFITHKGANREYSYIKPSELGFLGKITTLVDQINRLTLIPVIL